MGSCVSDVACPAAATGHVERARKDTSSRAVTRPAEVFSAPAFRLFENMPDSKADMCRCSRTYKILFDSDLRCRSRLH